MKKFWKWTGIVLGTLVGLVIISLIAIELKARQRLSRHYDLPEETIVIPTDDAAMERGRHIFQFRGCEACHGGKGHVQLLQSDQGLDTHLSSQMEYHMQGNVYLDDPALGKVIATNLTSGKGGVGGTYTDQNWIHAIRHGVRANGTPLLFMPSTEFYFLSDEDLGQVIAYIKSAPAVDNELPPSAISQTGKLVMILVPTITFLPAELILHFAERPAAPEVGVTPEYGEYLTGSCKVCHGLSMSGGAIPGFPSTWPAAPNLTFGAGSVLPAWDEAGFMTTIRTGITPEGRKLRGEYMPWGSYKFMYDDELKAVWVYLQSLPKKEYGNR